MRFEFHKMGPSNQVLFFKRAYKLADKFWLDRLNCSESFCRQLVEGATFEDAMRHHNDRNVPNCIVRESLRDGEPKHFEIGFSTITCNPDEYYLYLIVDYVKHRDEIVNYFEYLGGIIKFDD